MKDVPLAILIKEPQQLNPAIILAEELMRRDAAELLSVEEVAAAEKVLEIGASEIQAIEHHKAAFLKSRATSAIYVTHGF